MGEIVFSRVFPLLELTLIALSAALWWFIPHAGFWPALIALLPWLARLGAGRPQRRRTQLEAPLALFMLTALPAIWAAYDRSAAWDKFWLIAASILLFFSLSRLHHEQIWTAAAWLSALAAGIAIYFMLTHDWVAMPADLAWVNRLGLAWMGQRPVVSAAGLHPNIAGGMIAMLAPLPLALAFKSVQENRPILGIYALLTGGIAALGLLLTSSRAAWLALAVGLSAWLLGAAVRRFPQPRQVFAGIILVIAMAGLVALVAFPGGPLALLNRLPGPATAISRMEIYRGALRLAGDFPFTGGGLAAFPGLYAQYIENIPIFLFGYAHNIYLDLAVEQGAASLLLFLAVYAFSLWRLAPLKHPSRLAWPLAAATITLLAHGLVDDPLFAERGTPLLFLLPGMAIALADGRDMASSRKPARLLLPFAALAALAALVFWRPLLATGYANLGAARMARVELLAFPSGEWGDERLLPLLSSAQPPLDRAAELWPGGRPAQHRLGLLAYLAQDFSAAQQRLEAAYRLDPEHPGVRKALAYTYVWLGDFDRAAPLLAALPEAVPELTSYVDWQRAHGRADLSRRAQIMLQRISP
jgi:O-antigen ligase